MTKREGLLLASRAFALYLLCWGVSEVTYLPQLVLSIKHHSSVLISEDYWSRYYLVDFAFHILRIVALFATASWLYRCSPRVESYFLPPEKASQPEITSTQS